jgi:hypothetical protein
MSVMMSARNPPMRAVQNPQMQIGDVNISAITFDSRSRDDIPKILRGLQHIYTDLPLREELFRMLEAKIAPAVDKGTGRPGMTLRAMLGHGSFDNEAYHYQTLKDIRFREIAFPRDFNMPESFAQ